MGSIFPESEEVMLLADKIIELRKKNGWSQEDLAEKLDVSRQSVSKWESAQSVPDMKRILMMSEVFHVSTDYLLKDAIEAPGEDDHVEMGKTGDDLPVLKVSMADASAFLDFRRTKSLRIAVGITLCILSPIPLLSFSDTEKGSIAGLVILLIMVAGAVALFVTDGLAEQPLKAYEIHRLDTEYDVVGVARERRENYRSTHSRMLAGGIALCVASAIPVIISSGTKPIDGGFSTNGIAVSAVLLLVAIGVFCIAKCSIIWDGFSMLLEEGDYTREAKLENQKNAPIASIYWGTATAIYLFWSFVTGKWESTWIIWPIAGVIFGVLAAVFRLKRRKG